MELKDGWSDFKGEVFHIIWMSTESLDALYEGCVLNKCIMQTESEMRFSFFFTQCRINEWLWNVWVLERHETRKVWCIEKKVKVLKQQLS